MYSDKNEDLQSLLKTVMQGKALVIIGKHGITKAVREELKLQLEKKRVVKVKVLRSSGITDYNTALEKLANETSSILHKRVGRTGVYIRKKEPDAPKEPDQASNKYPWRKKRFN
ncbi:MAG: YhbY family RNA-binding protein [Candidatus Hodarchaeota archaeon]